MRLIRMKLPGKFIVQSQGSTVDPAYAEQLMVLAGEDVTFHEFFHRQGVGTLKDDLVNSCHGNTQLTMRLVRDMHKMARTGHKLVAIEQGGMYFAKPSIEAANMPTILALSVPLGTGIEGLASFLAPILPTGTAAIGGVVNNDYATAARVAVNVLNKQYGGVYLLNGSDKLRKRLDHLHIPVLGEAEEGLENAIVLARLEFTENPAARGPKEEFSRLEGANGNIGIYTYCNTKHPGAALTIQEYAGTLDGSVLTRGDDNLGYIAAKMMAADNPVIEKQLRADYRKKRASYDRERRIVEDAFTLGR